MRLTQNRCLEVVSKHRIDIELVALLNYDLKILGGLDQGRPFFFSSGSHDYKFVYVLATVTNLNW